MARFSGVVGYGITVEEPEDSGNWVSKIKEVDYRGDVLRNARSLENIDKVNSDITVSNSISIVADQFAVENFLNIEYVRWSGVLWTVTNVEVRAPRLILSLGGVYNGETP